MAVFTKESFTLKAKGKHRLPSHSLTMSGGRRAYSYLRCRLPDLSLSFLLMTGIFFLLHLSLVGAWKGIQGAFSTPTVYPIVLQGTARDTQIQPFLEALMALPQVRDAALVTKEQSYERFQQRFPESMNFLETTALFLPFVDTVEVTVRSLSDSDTLLNFLKRPELSSLLHPGFLPTFQERRSELSSSLVSQETSLRLFTALVVLCVLLLCVLSLQAVRERFALTRVRARLARLVGADPWYLKRPFFFEILVLLLLALLVSGGVFVLAFSHLRGFLPEALAQNRSTIVAFLERALLLEAVASIGIAYGATVLHFHFANETRRGV